MTAILPYIFDPEEGETAEGVARRRKVAEALAARIGAPQNVGQGLSAAGAAIGAILQSRKAAAAEAAGQADLEGPGSEIEKWFLGGGAGTPSAGVPSVAAPGPTPGIGFTPPPSAGARGPVPAGWSAGASPAPPTPPGVPAGWSAGAPAPPVTQTAFRGSQQDFINMLMPAAVELSKKTGLDPRLIVAQAAQETGWGRHAPGGNYFGIKSHGAPGGQTLATTEVYGGKPVAETASFRRYSGPEASVRGYGDFLQQNSRYKPMLAAQGLDAQLAELGKSGYATDPNYARSVGGIARGIPLPGGEAPGAQPLTQVASLDPSIGLPALPTLPGGTGMPPVKPPVSPGVATVAAALPGAGGAPQPPVPPAPVPGGMQPPARMPIVPPSLPPGVRTVASAMAPPPPAAGGAPSPMPGAPMAPGAPVAPAAGGPPMPESVPPEILAQAMRIVKSTFANPAQRAMAADIIKRAMEARDPATQLALKKAWLEVQALENPKPTPSDVLAREKFEFEKAQPIIVDGVAYDRQPDGTLVPKTLKAAPAGTPSPLTKLIEERNAAFKANSADPNLKLYDQRIAREAAGEKGWSLTTNTDGTLTLTQGDVGGDQAAADAEAVARGKATPGLFVKIAEDLPAADALAQSVGQLGTALQGVETGAEPAFLEWVRKTFGVALGPQADKRQAVESIVDYLTPRMRVPGSGATSDMEMKTFKNALPSLMGTPGGNKIVVETLAALAERRVRMAQIGQDYVVGTVTSKEALDQMRALPDAFAAFKAIKPAPAPPAAGAGTSAPAGGAGSLEGRTATDKDGNQVIFKNGQWVPLQ